MPKKSDPLLLAIPEAFETPRLVVRAPRWEDGPAWNQAVRESLEMLQPWMSWAQVVPTAEESEATCRRARLRFLERTDLRFHLIVQDDGAFVGSCGLHRIDWDARKFEIGYWVRARCVGKGYVTEAVDGLTRFAARHLDANRLEIRCDARNLRSARVAERLGFTLEGTLRSERRGGGGRRVDTRVYAKVRGQEL